MRLITSQKRRRAPRSELLREAARMYIERKQRWEQIFSYGNRQAGTKNLREKDVLDEIRAYRRRKIKD